MSETVAAVILAEMGPDLSAFPEARNVVAWAGLSPGLNQSGPKQKNARTRKQKWLKTTLVQAAWAAVKTKDSYFRALYLRLKARRGAKKAIVAVANSMLTAAYHMVKKGVPYQEFGADYFQRRNTQLVAQQLLRRLRRMGYHVDLRAAA